MALSSTEAEFRGISKGICELLWLRSLLNEIGYILSNEMNLYCDNWVAIQIAQNPVQHDRITHVKIDRHFIKKKLEAKIVKVPFVKSEDQLTYVLIKTVSNQVFYNSLGKLDIENIYAPTWGGVLEWIKEWL